MYLPYIELTPAEEAAARAKEKAEQDALPYKWTQTIGDVDINITVPGNLKGRDLVVEIKKLSLTAGIKGQEPIIKACYPQAINPPTPLSTLYLYHLLLNRATSPTQSSLKNLHGRLRPRPTEPRPSRSTSRSRTSWSGGRTS